MKIMSHKEHTEIIDLSKNRITSLVEDIKFEYVERSVPEALQIEIDVFLNGIQVGTIKHPSYRAQYKFIFVGTTRISLDQTADTVNDIKKKIETNFKETINEIRRWF